MQTVTLTVNPQAFNTIIAGLEELPHKMSRGVIDELVKQVKDQTEAAPADPAPATTDDQQQEPTTE